MHCLCLLLVDSSVRERLIAGDAWTSVCSFRITLYRQRVAPDFCNHAQDVRFAYFQKCEGIVVKDEDAKNVPFLITVSPSHVYFAYGRTMASKTSSSRTNQPNKSTVYHPLKKNHQ